MYNTTSDNTHRRIQLRIAPKSVKNKSDDDRPHYNLRQNNYKQNLKNKVMNEIKECMDTIDNINKYNQNDIASKIIKLRRIYLLLNENIDLVIEYVCLFDIAYKRIDIFSITIVEYMAKNLNKSLRTSISALNQFNKYKKYYKNYWANITDALNTKLPEDMNREILQYIH